MSIDKETFCTGISDRFAIYTFLLLDGMTISRKDVTICDLRHILDEYRHYNKPMIQVCSKKHNEIYHSPTEALEDFWRLSE